MRKSTKGKIRRTTSLGGYVCLSPLLSHTQQRRRRRRSPFYSIPSSPCWLPLCVCVCVSPGRRSANPPPANLLEHSTRTKLLLLSPSLPSFLLFLQLCELAQLGSTLVASSLRRIHLLPSLSISDYVLPFELLWLYLDDGCHIPLREHINSSPQQQQQRREGGWNGVCRLFVHHPTKCHSPFFHLTVDGVHPRPAAPPSSRPRVLSRQRQDHPHSLASTE